MPIRTTPTLVRTIIDSNLATEPLLLDAYIETASSIVDDVCVDTDDYTYTSAKLELIERWLSAHCFAGNRRRTLSQSIGQGAVAQRFDPLKLDLNLNNTFYGQMAMALDTQGNLAAANAGKGKVSLHWLGTACEC